MRSHARSARRVAGAVVLLTAGAVLQVGTAGQAGASLTPTGVEGGPATIYTNTAGDSWSTTWADDDALYATSDDTYGIDQACPMDDVNIAIHKFTGNDPRTLSGTTVSCMPDYANTLSTHPDGRKWKIGGLVSVGGVLYMSVTRDKYTNPDYGGRQDSQNATIIKSTDHGVTWSGSEANSYANPMFPGHAFGKPAFIEYGKDGTGGVDGGDTYVYAISNNGFWNNGDSVVLGRVLRTRIGSLSAADWQFWTTGGTWVSNPANATSLISNQGKLSQAQVTYVPGLHQYVLAAWYYPSCCSTTNRTSWDFYRAPAPWGPWTAMGEREWKPAGFYNPTILSKFQTTDGSRVWAVTAGDYGTPDYSKHGQTGFNGYYSFTALPLTFGDFGALINDDAGAVSYSGSGWVASGSRGKGDHNDDVHYTTTQGSYAQYTFTGTGVQYFAETNDDQGAVDISIDGTPVARVSGSSYKRVGRVLLWSTNSLASASHTIRVTNASTSGQYLLVDAFRTLTDGGPNLLGAPGFEVSGSWQSYGAATRVTTNAYTGSWSGTATGASNGQWQVLTVQPNTTYVLRGYGRKDAALDHLVLYVKNYGGGAQISAEFPGASYSDQSLRFTTGPSTTTAEVGYWAWSGSGTGSGNVDDIVLAKG